MKPLRNYMEILVAMTKEERNALKAIASGKAGTVYAAELGKLKSLDLVRHDGREISLTSSGLEIVDFC